MEKVTNVFYADFNKCSPFLKGEQPLYPDTPLLPPPQKKPPLIKASATAQQTSLEDVRRIISGVKYLHPRLLL